MRGGAETKRTYALIFHASESVRRIPVLHLFRRSAFSTFSRTRVSSRKFSIRKFSVDPLCSPVVVVFLMTRGVVDPISVLVA